MHASSLLLGLATLYTASAIPTKAVPDNLNLAARDDDPLALPTLPNLPIGKDEESKAECIIPISSGQTLSAGQSCLDKVRSRGDKLSGVKKGSVEELCSEGDSKITTERKGEDSSWSDVACALESILNSCQVTGAGEPKVAGCQNACGSSDYVICVNKGFDPFS